MQKETHYHYEIHVITLSKGVITIGAKNHTDLEFITKLLIQNNYDTFTVYENGKVLVSR